MKSMNETEENPIMFVLAGNNGIGRELIDEFNFIKMTSFSLSESQNLDIVNVQDLLDKYASDKKELSTFLIPMEKQIHRLLNDLKKANKDINHLKNEKRDLEKQIQDEKELSYRMQHLIYQMFSYIPSGATLDNLMNTFTSRTERVSNALQKRI
ncbi:hypothetical protein AAGG74_16475 [Bacillus mexicanus]|uniref:hypothetical protein n=1 Tax=Bacillus mexicanus TaxID=2834415 RepID=UPI003D21E251